MASWMTWKCFLAGLRFLGIFSAVIAGIACFIGLIIWAIEGRHQKLALTILICFFAGFIVFLGMLQCAGIIH